MFLSDGWKLAASMWVNGIALQETAFATSGVIRHRTGTIRDAMTDPRSADVVELNRMMPEKVAAFGQAGHAIATDWLDIHEDLLAQGRDMLTLFPYRPPSVATIERLGRRSSTLVIKMSTAVGRALEPVHAAATANHRRLDKIKGTAR